MDITNSVACGLSVCPEIGRLGAQSPAESNHCINEIDWGERPGSFLFFLYLMSWPHRLAFAGREHSAPLKRVPALNLKICVLIDSTCRNTQKCPPAGLAGRYGLKYSDPFPFSTFCYCNGNFNVCAFLITNFCVHASGWLIKSSLSVAALDVSVSSSQLREKKPREVLVEKQCEPQHPF
jgi:hypothetical protein